MDLCGSISITSGSLIETKAEKPEPTPCVIEPVDEVIRRCLKRRATTEAASEEAGSLSPIKKSSKKVKKEKSKRLSVQ